MSSVRERWEAAEMNRRYLAQSAPKITQQAEDERRERLAQNARQISEDRVNTLLLDMTDTESEVVFDICNRESPASLGNPVVLHAILTRCRTIGVEHLRRELQDTSREEQELVWRILSTASSEAKLGMDGGRACREALQDVRHKQFMEE